MIVVAIIINNLKKYMILIMIFKYLLLNIYLKWQNLKPTYEALADSYDHVSEKVIIARIDADKFQDIRKAEGLRSYPVNLYATYILTLI